VGSVGAARYIYSRDGVSHRFSCNIIFMNEVIAKGGSGE
jgi:hypothetical protein